MRVLFSVVEDDFGLRVDWHPDMLEVVDDQGRDTDHLLGFAEELLEAEKSETQP